MMLITGPTAFSLLPESPTTFILDPVVATSSSVGSANGRIRFNKTAVVDSSIWAPAGFRAELFIEAPLLLTASIGGAALLACCFLVQVNLVYDVTLKDWDSTDVRRNCTALLFSLVY